MSFWVILISDWGKNMIEFKKDDFLKSEIINIKNFGSTFSINPKYGSGICWVYQVTPECVITLHKIKFNQETLLEYQLPDKYVFAFYMSGAGNEFFPYQSITPNTMRAYEPLENYKVVYHPQIELISLSIELSTFFIEQYVKEHYKNLASDLHTFFSRKHKFFILNMSRIIYEIYNCNDSCSPDVFITSKIYEILSEVSSYVNRQEFIEEQQSKISDDDILALQEITLYIDEHYNYDITLDMLSKIACMSVSKLKVLFKHAYNMTAIEFIQRKRMSVAEHLLISTSLSINEISRIVGYSNPSRFTELFKRYYGFTPSNYR